jgi:hypothetical protein
MLSVELRSESMKHQRAGTEGEAIVDAEPKLAVRHCNLRRTPHRLQDLVPREWSHHCYVQTSKADELILSIHLALVCLYDATNLQAHCRRQRRLGECAKEELHITSRMV